MAPHVLSKCKHLFMLKFRVVSPSLTTNSIYTAYSTLYNQFGNMISAM